MGHQRSSCKRACLVLHSLSCCVRSSFSVKLFCLCDILHVSFTTQQNLIVKSLLTEQVGGRWAKQGNQGLFTCSCLMSSTSSGLDWVSVNKGTNRDSSGPSSANRAEGQLIRFTVSPCLWSLLKMLWACVLPSFVSVSFKLEPFGNRETQVRKMPPPDWPMEKPGVNFLDECLLGAGPPWAGGPGCFKSGLSRP